MEIKEVQLLTSAGKLEENKAPIRLWLIRCCLIWITKLNQLGRETASTISALFECGKTNVTTSPGNPANQQTVKYTPNGRPVKMWASEAQNSIVKPVTFRNSNEPSNKEHSSILNNLEGWKSTKVLDYRKKAKRLYDLPLDSIHRSPG